MRKPIAYVVILLVAAGVAAYFVIQAMRVTEEDRVRKVITKVAEAAEKRSTFKFLDYVAADYGDNRNNDYSSLRYYLPRLFMQYQKITVSLRGVRIQMLGEDRATVRCSALIKGVPKDGTAMEDILGRHTGDEVFQLSLRKEEGDWLIYRVEHRPAR